MALSSVATIALQGLRERAQNLESTANDIANAEPDTPSQQGEYEGADMATGMLGLSEEEAAYRANAAVFEAGADLWQILGVVTRD